MTIQEELKSIFAKFNLTVAQVQVRLSEVGLFEHARYLHNPPKRAWAQHVYFAIASLVLGKAGPILEVGTGSGTSTNTLSKLFLGSTIYTIDVGLDDPNGKWAWKYLHPNKCAVYDRNLNRENIKIIESNSFFLPALKLPKKFSLIYVDGYHSHPVVAADISFAYSHLRKGGFLFMHDYEIERVEHDVSNVVNWMRERIKEEILEFPEFISSCNRQANMKMACLIKE